MEIIIFTIAIVGILILVIMQKAETDRRRKEDSVQMMIKLCNTNDRIDLLSSKINTLLQHLGMTYVHGEGITTAPYIQESVTAIATRKEIPPEIIEELDALYDELFEKPKKKPVKKRKVAKKK